VFVGTSFFKTGTLFWIMLPVFLRSVPLIFVFAPTNGSELRNKIRPSRWSNNK
jgi:hypothetical protein